VISQRAPVFFFINHYRSADTAGAAIGQSA